MTPADAATLILDRLKDADFAQFTEVPLDDLITVQAKVSSRKYVKGEWTITRIALQIEVQVNETTKVECWGVSKGNPRDLEWVLKGMMQSVHEDLFAVMRPELLGEKA